MNHRCEVRPEDLGPLLLDQLQAEQARAVQRAVERCPDCAADVELLRPVVAALAASRAPDEADGPAGAGPAEDRLVGDGAWRQAHPRLLGAVLAGVHREQAAARRRRLLVAAAAAVLLVLTVTGTQLAVRSMSGPEGGPGGRAVAADVVLSGPPGTWGRMKLADGRFGTDVRLHAGGLDPLAVYGVWLATADGGRLPAGSFRPTTGGTADVTLTAALALRDSRTAGVTRLPAGTRPKLDVLTARLSP